LQSEVPSFRTYEASCGCLIQDSGTVRFIFPTVFSAARKESALLRIAEGVRATHDADGGIILDIHHGHMFTLNIVGSQILGMLKLSWPELKIIDEISSRYGIRSDIVERDVREFLECLQKHNLVEYKPRTSAT